MALIFVVSHNTIENYDNLTKTCNKNTMYKNKGCLLCNFARVHFNFIITHFGFYLSTPYAKIIQICCSVAGYKEKPSHKLTDL